MFMLFGNSISDIFSCSHKPLQSTFCTLHDKVQLLLCLMNNFQDTLGIAMYNILFVKLHPTKSAKVLSSIFIVVV